MKFSRMVNKLNSKVCACRVLPLILVVALTPLSTALHMYLNIDSTSYCLVTAMEVQFHGCQVVLRLVPLRA